MFIYRSIGRKNRAHYSVIQILRFGAVAPKTFRVGPINKTSDDGAFQKTHRDSAETLGARKRLLGTNCAKLHEDTLLETSLPARGYSLIHQFLFNRVFLAIRSFNDRTEDDTYRTTMNIVKINTSSLSIYVVVLDLSLSLFQDLDDVSNS